MPGEGKRAVVYNSPSFHVTGVAMFSCVLMSLGFDVTAVVKVNEQHTRRLYIYTCLGGVVLCVRVCFPSSLAAKRRREQFVVLFYRCCSSVPCTK